MSSVPDIETECHESYTRVHQGVELMWRREHVHIHHDHDCNRGHDHVNNRDHVDESRHDRDHDRDDNWDYAYSPKRPLMSHFTAKTPQTAEMLTSAEGCSAAPLRVLCASL